MGLPNGVEIHQYEGRFCYKNSTETLLVPGIPFSEGYPGQKIRVQILVPLKHRQRIVGSMDYMH